MSTTDAAVSPEYRRQMEYEQQRRQMQREQHYPAPSRTDELMERMNELEQFFKYAADVDPNFKKLLVGYKAKKRIGL